LWQQQGIIPAAARFIIGNMNLELAGINLSIFDDFRFYGLYKFNFQFDQVSNICLIELTFNLYLRIRPE